MNATTIDGSPSSSSIHCQPLMPDRPCVCSISQPDTTLPSVRLSGIATRKPDMATLWRRAGNQ